MTTFGISIQSFERIQEVLADFDEVERVEIFGSRAKGNYKKGSDIDLAIYGRNLRPETALHLEAKLNEDTPIPYFVDVLAPRFLHDPELIDHIHRVGLPFYEKYDVKKPG